MSYYEIASTLDAFVRKDRAEPLTDNDFDGMLNALRALNLPDVKV